MDKESPELDDRIASALSGLGSAAAAGELASSLASGSVVADVRLGGGRDAVLMAAVASRLVSEPGLKALVIAPSDREVAGLKTAFDALVRKTKLSCATIGRDGSAEESAALIGSIDAIASRVAAGTLESRDFGLIALSDLAVMADIASAAMLRRALGQASPDRRLVAFSSELGPAHRAIARDIGGSYVELELEAEGERVKSAPAITYSVTAVDKPRLLLGLLAAEDRRPVVVFCSMRDTAEETAKLLRARGVRVDYVLGNLPRKRAVLEATKSGGNDVLVLTDEGASGLPGSWAATLVNWDLPLEGEPYMERLEHLDASKGDARVYNFACERYSYGIPAIERVLGSRLEVVPADESMMISENPGRAAAPGAATSEARPKAAPGPATSEARPKAAPERGPDRKRPDDRRDDRRDRGDHGGQYDGRNARAIQADIAAITGGRPLSGSPSTPEPATEKAGKRRGRKGKGTPPKPLQGQPPKTASSDQARRGGERAGARDERKAPKQGPRRARGGSGPRLTDPYSVSMEERLKLYRERYAASDGGGSGRAGSGKGQQPETRKGDKQADRRPSERRPGERHQSDRLAQAHPKPHPQDNKRGDAPRSQARTAGSKAPADTSETPSAPKGIAGILRGLFGSKGE